MSGVAAWQVNGLGVSLFCSVAGMLLLLVAAGPSAEARIRSVRHIAASRASPAGHSPPGARVLGGIGRSVLRSGLLSRKAIEDLEQTMEAAGQRTGAALALFVGAKIVLFFGLPALAWTSSSRHGLAELALLIMVMRDHGLMAPDSSCAGSARVTSKAVEAGLPVALDLLIICAEAGLALEAGMERVAKKRRRQSHRQRTAGDRQRDEDPGRPRQALVNMGTRTGLESMVRLGSALAQSMKYGTRLTWRCAPWRPNCGRRCSTRFKARAARSPCC